MLCILSITHYVTALLQTLLAVFLNQNLFCQSSILSFHGGAPSPEKNPGSVPEHINLLFSFSAFTLILIFPTFLSIDLNWNWRLSLFDLGLRKMLETWRWLMREWCGV